MSAEKINFQPSLARHNNQFPSIKTMMTTIQIKGVT